MASLEKNEDIPMTPTLTAAPAPTATTNHTVVVEIINSTGRAIVKQSTDISLSVVGEKFSSTDFGGKTIGTFWVCDVHLTPKNSKKVDSIAPFVAPLVKPEKTAPAAPDTTAPEATSTAFDTPEAAPLAITAPEAAPENYILPLVDFSLWGSSEYHITDEARKVFGVAYNMLLHNGDKPVKILMTGESGNGKTTLAKQFAKFTGLRFLRVNCATMRDVTDWFGQMLVEKHNDADVSVMRFVPSEFSEAIERGNVVICLDEFNRVETQLHNSLYPILDDDAATSVYKREYRVGKNVVFCATVNLGYKYGGTSQMDEAVINRFESILEVSHPPFDVEAALLSHHYGLSDTDAQTIIKIATSIRDNNVTVCSTRSTLAIAKLFAYGMSLFDAFDTHLIRRIPNDDTGMLDRKALLDLVKSMIASADAPAPTF